MILFPEREDAVLADGDVRKHYKGGIYRKLLTAKDCDSGKLRSIYEHLHPHPHEYYDRAEEEFEGTLPDGSPRFEVLNIGNAGAACATCRFWKPMNELEGRGAQCRKNPPIAIPGRGNADWPKTRPQDWCGQYARKV